MSIQPTATPAITEEAISDLVDLYEAIEKLLLAIAKSDEEAADLQYRETLHLMECAALFHCDIAAKILRNNEHSVKAAGLRQISVPANWEGRWFVNPTEASL